MFTMGGLSSKVNSVKYVVDVRGLAENQNFALSNLALTRSRNLRLIRSWKKWGPKTQNNRDPKEKEYRGF